LNFCQSDDVNITWEDRFFFKRAIWFWLFLTLNLFKMTRADKFDKRLKRLFPIAIRSYVSTERSHWFNLTEILLKKLLRSFRILITSYTTISYKGSAVKLVVPPFNIIIRGITEVLFPRILPRPMVSSWKFLSNGTKR